MLLPYLHGEAARSERALVHAHLSACQDCQSELAALERAEALVSRGLHAQAALRKPPARAWLRLQSALQADPQPASFARPGGVLAQIGCTLRRAAPAFTAIAIVAVGLQAFIKTPQVIGIPESTPGAMLATEPAGPVRIYAPAFQAERASDALSGRVESPDLLDTADLADRNMRMRATQKLVAPRTTRRSYLLPPVSGELIEDSTPIRPCADCGQADDSPDVPIRALGNPQTAAFTAGSRPFVCVACAIQR